MDAHSTVTAEEGDRYPLGPPVFSRSCMKASRKDIMGTALKPDAVVIYSENGRIVFGRIIKIYENSTTVRVKPLLSDTNGRRSPPTNKEVRREDYNVFVVNEGEFVVGTLKGYTHDTGRWTYDPDADEDD